MRSTMSRDTSESALPTNALDSLTEPSRVSSAFEAAKRAADGLTAWIDRKLGALRIELAALIVAISSFLLCFFLYSPPLWIGLPPDARTHDLARQAADPLTRALYEPILTYRPMHPFIMHVVGVRSVEWVHVFPIVYAITFLFLLFLFLRSRTSAGVAVLACFALSTTMVVQSGTYWLGFPDPLCCLVAAAMMLLRPHWALVLVPMGMLTDERFILTAGTIPLLKMRLAASRFDLKRFSGYAAAVLVGVGVTFAVRYALTVGWIGPGIVMPKVYDRLTADLLRLVPNHVADKPYLVPLAMFFAFRFAWLLPIAAVRTCQSRDERIFQGLGGLLLLFGSYAVFIGGDWTRSLCFLFPILFLALFQLEARDRTLTARILLAVIALNVFTPQLNIDHSPGRLGLVRPLPIALTRYLAAPEGTGLFR